MQSFLSATIPKLVPTGMSLGMVALSIKRCMIFSYPII